MRDKLRDINGRRITVTANVSDFGKKKQYKGYPLDTVLLTDIKDIHNNTLCDHIWLVIRKQLTDLDIQVGDKLIFDARVKPYLKGYKGRREDVYKPVEKDYKLSHPTNFKKKHINNENNS